MRSGAVFFRSARGASKLIGLWLAVAAATACDDSGLIEGPEVTADSAGNADADGLLTQTDAEAGDASDASVAPDGDVATPEDAGSDAQVDADDPDGLDTLDALDGLATDDDGSAASDVAAQTDAAGSDNVDGSDAASTGSDTGVSTTDTAQAADGDAAEPGSDAAAEPDTSGATDATEATDATGAADQTEPVDQLAGTDTAIAADSEPGSDATGTDDATDEDVADGGPAPDAIDAAAGPDADLTDAGGTDSGAADAELPDTGADDAASDSAGADTADPDTADADTADADTAGPVACASDAPCTPLGQVCDPLAKQCVACLWDSHCGALAQCQAQTCVPIVPCQNSLSCLTAVGLGGTPLPICDAESGQCVGCLTDPDCGDGYVCSEQTCQPFAACINSLTCGNDQVCDTNLGQCVECVSAQDCGASQTCDAGTCVDYVACSSDKQCTPLGMLCNTSKGKCARCLGNSDCPALYHCAPEGVDGTGTCVLDVCQQGQSRCDGNQITNCNAVGNGWSAPAVCPAQTTCTTAGLKASCTPWVCSPGLGCVDGKAIVCSSDGLQVTSSIDCAATGDVCDGGQCKTPICQPGTSWCDGAVLQTCAATGLSVVSSPACGSGSHCTPTGCAANVCTPNQPACLGQTAGTCNATGSGLLGGATPCGELLCVQGQCKALLCVPSSTSCNGNTRETCSADGLSVIASNPCPANQYCSDGSCLPQVCTPNQPVCDGQTARVCNSLGSGYTADATTCKQGTELCKAGSCVPLVCTPAATFCQGNVLSTCSADGTAVLTSSACAQGTYCGTTPQGSAACLPTVCQPNSAGCNGNVASTCNANGSGWLAAGVDCSSTDQICSGGTCKSLVCNPQNPTYCVGNTVYACSSDGLSTSVQKTCSNSQYCAGGTCLAQICVPGAAGCLGNQPAVCNASGSAQTATGAACGLGTSCAAGSCIACVPSGSEVCDGLDNDCDGQVDEALAAPLCDDGNDCTTDTCAATGKCQFVPVAAGAPCGEDGGCMLGRTCSAGGVCQAGTSRFFDQTVVLTPDTETWFNTVGTMGNGDVVVAGKLGAAPILARLSATGKVIWQTGTQVPTVVRDIQVDDAGGIYVLGEAALNKFNAAGEFQWTYATTRPGALRVVPAGGAYLLLRSESAKVCDSCAIGGTKCKDDFGTNLVLTRLNGDGTVRNSVPFDNLYASTSKLVVTPDRLIWGHDGELVAAIQTDDVCGWSSGASLLRMSPGGSVKQWVASLGDYRSIARTGSGFVMLQSSAYTWYDKSFVATGSKSVTASYLSLAANGDVYTAGLSTVPAPVGTTTVATVRRYSPGGALRWSKTFDYAAVGTSYVRGLVAQTDGVLMAGNRSVGELHRGWLVRMDDWGHTSCGASGDCWQTSVLACAACSAETCDGTDNDCNGMTDELACDDSNPCVSTSCNGSSCASTSVDGGPCQDGNACTNSDACLGGTCKSGQAWTCDDGNACTADSCTPQTGCAHALVNGCAAQVCTPGDGGCLGTQPTVCSPGGDAEVPTGAPCGAGTVCASGACVSCVASGAEVCDGADNDCDGAIDEADAGPLCSDDNDCTTDTCTAAGTCAYAPQAAGTPCGTDDSCTTGRVCNAEGTCLAGASRYFDKTHASAESTPTYWSVARLSGGDLVLLMGTGTLVRLNAQGNIAWQVALTSLSAPRQLAVDAADAIYVGASNGVRKYNSAGATQWTYTTTRPGAIAAAPAGGVYVLLRSQSYQHCVKCSAGALNTCKADMGHQLALVQLASDGTVVGNTLVDPMPVVTTVYQLDPASLGWSSDGQLVAAATTAEVCTNNRTSLLKFTTSGQVLQWRPDIGEYAELTRCGAGFVARHSDKFIRLDKDLQTLSTTTITSTEGVGTPEGDLYLATPSSSVTPGGTFTYYTIHRYAPDGTLVWSRPFDYTSQGSSDLVASLAGSQGVVFAGKRGVQGAQASWVFQMDGWGHTSCEASGNCWETPLSACTSCAAEVCDGQDNDCNGLTDDATCPDPNACMQSSCEDGGCVLAVKQQAACLDGNACTVLDTCSNGYCTAGAAASCDDANPCTADSCTAQAGCAHTPVAGPTCGG